MTALAKKTIRQIFQILGFRIEPQSYKTVPQHHVETILQAYSSLFQSSRGISFTDNNCRLSMLAQQRGTPAPEALFIIEALVKTASIEGDVCEFGVAQGATSALIANEIIDTPKRLHLFDSFEGLSRPGEKDVLKDDVLNLGSMAAYEGRMSHRENEVLSRLKAVGFPEARTVIHKGFIDAVLAKKINLPSKVSFAYVDFDFYDPLRDALNFLDGVTDAGAILVVDDYDFFSTGAKTAVDEFIESHNNWEIEVPDKSFGCFAILTKR